MRMKSTSGFILLVDLLSASLLTGCRKELCYDHHLHGLSVRADVKAVWEQEWEREYAYDWEELWMEEWTDYDIFRPKVAEGIRAVVYRSDGSFYENNISSDGGIISLYEGSNDLMFYNNDTEYIVFDGLDASTRATASTRTLTRGGFSDLHSGERTVNPPDQLYGCYVEDYEAHPTVVPVELPVTMKPLTYTYIIWFIFDKGIEHVALARGALAGMAEKVYINDGSTGDETATLMFDCSVQEYGAIAAVLSFGAPNFPGHHYTRADGTEAKYTLSLQVRLNNGNIPEDFVFDVTEYVNNQPRGGVIVVDGIEISDEDMQGGEGGFNVDVDGWGDYVDIPLPL